MMSAAQYMHRIALMERCARAFAVDPDDVDAARVRGIDEMMEWMEKHDVIVDFPTGEKADGR